VSDPIPELATGRPIVFYTPHQDDETLWAGLVLAHHALVGRQVHVVCASDGSTSAMRAALNGEADNGWWGGWHYPPREGIPAPLSPADFAAARDRELLNAAVQLGVPAANVHLETETRGTTITKDQAKALIRKYEDLYPDAGHYTMWWGDTDPTHKALGEALHELALTEPAGFNDCRWIVRRGQASTTAAVADGVVEYVVPSALAAEAVHMARCAAKAYGSWSPPVTYGIGQHSVPSDFAAVGRGEPNWIIKTP